MKTLTTIILMIVSVHLLAQAQRTTKVKGIDDYYTPRNNPEFVEEMNDCAERWIWYDLYETEDTYYSMYFKATPVGLKHAIEQTTRVLNLNQEDFDNPDVDNSLIPSSVNDVYDYANVNAGVRLGDVEIDMIWYIPGWIVSLTSSSNYERYIIYVIPIDLDKVK